MLAAAAAAVVVVVAVVMMVMGRHLMSAGWIYSGQLGCSGTAHAPLPPNSEHKHTATTHSTRIHTRSLTPLSLQHARRPLAVVTPGPLFRQLDPAP